MTGLLAAAAVAMSAGGSEVPFGAVAEAFWTKDLGRTLVTLDTVLAQRSAPSGAQGGPAHFWRELLDLVDCLPLTAGQTTPHMPKNDWEALVALVRLERMRIARIGLEAPAGLGGDLAKGDFFVRLSTAVPEEAVSWPAGEELWSDEFLRPEPRAPGCADFPPSDAKTQEKQLEQELALTESTLRYLPVEHPAWTALGLHQAALLVRLGRVDDALDVSRPLSRRRGEAKFTPVESDQAGLLEAMDLDRRGERAEALTLYRRLLESPHLLPVRRYIEARILAALADTRRWAELLDALPAGSDITTDTGRYRAYLRGRALFETGRFALLLDHGREVLREAPVDASIAALADLVTTFLASAPFDEQVVEIVEGLGPPRLVYARLERFAHVALERGYPASAKGALTWLLAHHQAAHYFPRYQAKLAEVAWATGDLAGYVAQLGSLTLSEERLRAIIPPNRRAKFWEERDTQLLALTRGLMARLAERGDDRWTEPLVAALQGFLRDSADSRVSRPLTEVYRTARALLGAGARKYAESIGDSTPPLVLGEVKLERPLPPPPAPPVPPVIDEPLYLIRIPVGAAPAPVRPWFAEVPR